MRTTINIDDDTLTRANELFSSMKPTELVNKAIAEMVARESARRLSDLFGAEPDATAPERRAAIVTEEPIEYNPR